MASTTDYRDGTDLLLSIDVNGVQTALGHSTECKIAYKAETGTRKTKEASAGKWDEKYVKSLGVSITASGFVFGGDEEKAGLPTLEDIFLAHIPVKASWDYRGETDKKHYHEGMFVLTQIDQEGKAGDDETYSITLENSGAVTKGGSTSSGTSEVPGNK